MTHRIHLAAPLQHTARVRVNRTREWMKVREVAALLKVTRSRVSQLVAEGRFATVVHAGEHPKSPVLVARHCVDAELEKALCTCRETQGLPCKGEVVQDVDTPPLRAENAARTRSGC